RSCRASALRPSGRGGGDVLDVPLVRRAQAVLERNARPPAEALQPADVEELARRAVGLAAVELDTPLEADDGPDQLGQLGNRDVLVDPDVDDLWRVVVLHQVTGRVGEIVDVQK